MRIPKFIPLILLTFCITIFVGCGHSLARTDHGVGLSFRIPLPDGYSLVDLKIGNIDSQTLVLRGGSTFTSDTSKGGTLDAISVDDHTRMSTVPSINEGYAAKVLTSPNNDNESKRMLIQYLLQNGKPKEVKSAQTTSVVDTKEYSASINESKKPVKLTPLEKMMKDKSLLIICILMIICIALLVACHIIYYKGNP